MPGRVECRATQRLYSIGLAMSQIRLPADSASASATVRHEEPRTQTAQPLPQTPPIGRSGHGHFRAGKECGPEGDGVWILSIILPDTREANSERPVNLRHSHPLRSSPHPWSLVTSVGLFPIPPCVPWLSPRFPRSGHTIYPPSSSVVCIHLWGTLPPSEAPFVGSPPFLSAGSAPLREPLLPLPIRGTPHRGFLSTRIASYHTAPSPRTSCLASRRRAATPPSSVSTRRDQRRQGVAPAAGAICSL